MNIQALRYAQGDNDDLYVFRGITDTSDMNILAQIVESKKLEIEGLRREYPAMISEVLKTSEVVPSPIFYQKLSEAQKQKRPFFITEFKRKSPSEGWINQQADLPAQIRTYAQAGASAISVLTDEPFFGGTYADLKLARAVLDDLPSEQKPLLLQKEFILDPIQIHLAKHFGADLILLIAAILEPEQLDLLRKTAESLGLGVLVEVHDSEELDKIQHLEFPVLGINNRDLKTFRTALNRVNVLKKRADNRFVIAESGVLNARHFQMVKQADGFLIGTGLMRGNPSGLSMDLSTHFQSKGHWIFKACGIRTRETIDLLIPDLPDNQALAQEKPDFIGINFSPASKRRMDDQASAHLKNIPLGAHAVAVFYQNSNESILETLRIYPFKTVQLYAGDVTPAFVRQLKTRVILAVKIDPAIPWSETLATLIEPYAADVDCFILDGAMPGSGQRIDSEIPRDFPYPFLLAGGINASNLDAAFAYSNCIGVDVASGIEISGQVDLGQIQQIARALHVPAALAAG